MLSFAYSKVLNGLMLGEEYAVTMGIRIQRTRIIIFATTSILAGTITAFCGPIGFIGIAVPHMARFLFRQSDHRILFPATMLTGMVVLVFSDIVSQLPGTERILAHQCGYFPHRDSGGDLAGCYQSKSPITLMADTKPQNISSHWSNLAIGYQKDHALVKRDQSIGLTGVKWWP